MAAASGPVRLSSGASSTVAPEVFAASTEARRFPLDDGSVIEAPRRGSSALRRRREPTPRPRSRRTSWGAGTFEVKPGGAASLVDRGGLRADRRRHRHTVSDPRGAGRGARGGGARNRPRARRERARPRAAPRRRAVAHGGRPGCVDPRVGCACRPGAPGTSASTVQHRPARGGRRASERPSLPPLRYRAPPSPRPPPPGRRSRAAGTTRQPTDSSAPSGLTREASGASVDDLLMLADVARLSAHGADAVAPLSRVVTDHAGDASAPLAAFTLGRLELDSLGRPGGGGHGVRRAAIALAGLPAGLVEERVCRASWRRTQRQGTTRRHARSRRSTRASSRTVDVPRLWSTGATARESDQAAEERRRLVG